MTNPLVQRLGLALVALATCVSSLSADDSRPFETTVRSLLVRHCAGCHGGEKPAGGVRFDQPATDLADAKVRATWEKAYAMLVRGDMPPEEKPRLSTDDLDTLTSWIRREVERAVIAERGGSGRMTMRRLTRVEYARLLEDVLGLRYPNVPLNLQEMLPTDPQSELPLNDGDRLTFQSLHLKASIDLVERLVKAVLADEPRPEPWSYRFDARGLGKANVAGMKQGEQGLGGAVPANEKEIKRAAKISIGVAERNPDGSTTLPPIYRTDDYLGRDKMGAGSWYLELPYVEPKGVLRLRIRAGSNVPKGEGVPVLRVAFHNNVINQLYNRQLAEIPIENSAEQHRDYDVEIPLDLVDFPYVLFERSKMIGVRISNDATPLADREKPTGPKGKPVEWPYQESKIVIESVEAFGPGAGEWPPRCHTALTVAGDKLNDDRERAAAILLDVAARAWRRPVATEEIAPFVDIYQQRRADGQSRDGALREPLTAVLVSPHAPYLVERKAEKPSPLSGVELANRLSIFLWGSGPDRELLDLATAGKLHDRQVLAAQVDRLLDDARSQVFADDFVTRMLALERVENDPIDFNLTLKSFANAKVAELREQRLKHDLAREPVRYFEHLLRNNRSAYELIGSDYLIVNDRLAHYYGMGGVEGPAFREVAAPEDRRGGWLTMAGVVAAASRGNKEATILRGVYLLDRFLGEHPGAPPGNVEPLEVQAKSDKKRGQRSLREQIALHTSINTCALCHRKIDPLGFAWADFDYLGKRSSGRAQSLRSGTDAEPDGSRHAANSTIDCSGKLPDGRAFADLDEFAQLVGDQQQPSRYRFGEVLVRRLTGYALSRPLNLSDEELIRSLVQSAQRNGWRVREIIKSIVLADSFTHG